MKIFKSRVHFITIFLLSFLYAISGTFFEKSIADITTAQGESSTQTVGNLECGSGGRSNFSTRTNTMQRATLESRGEGYTLKFLESNRSEESVLELYSSLVVERARTGESPWNLVAYDRAPISIQPNGEFRISMMVSSRSSCTFSGTLQFIENVRSQLFPSNVLP